MTNLDKKTVMSFGDEWSRFDQSGMSKVESRNVFEKYFSVFPWQRLSSDSEGFDMGCGSGRWSYWMAPRVGRLHCIEPSEAIDVAKKNLSMYQNVVFHRTSVYDSGLSKGSQDFGYSLGVLHHVPDTAEAICSCVSLLKPGAPLLLYLYYSFENRPWWFRSLWRISDWGRRLIFRLPSGLKYLITNIIATLVYWPLARLSRILERCGVSVNNMPLSYYRNNSFYTMRTDARDRFGTPLEHRYTREQIKSMMTAAGLIDIDFSETAPFWCVVGVKSE